MCRFKVCDVLDVPASYAKGCFRIDALGEALCILRLPAVHPFGPTLREGEVVVLVESTLGGVDPSRDLMGACDPRRNPRAQRWHSQEINQMVFIWHHDDNHSPEPADLDASVETPICAAEPQKPLWPIPLIPGIDGWRYHGRVTHEVSSTRSNQQIREYELRETESRCSKLIGPASSLFVRCFLFRSPATSRRFPRTAQTWRTWTTSMAASC